MSEERDCVVKLVDDHGVEHGVRVRTESVYEAALKGLKKLERVGWESNGEQIGSVTVEVWEEPTFRVSVPKLLQWLKGSGRSPYDETRKEKLRKLIKSWELARPYPLV
jgi:hypothetical protein